MAKDRQFKMSMKRAASPSSDDLPSPKVGRGGGGGGGRAAPAPSPGTCSERCLLLWNVLVVVSILQWPATRRGLNHGALQFQDTKLGLRHC